MLQDGHQLLVSHENKNGSVMLPATNYSGVQQAEGLVVVGHGAALLAALLRIPALCLDQL